MQTGGIGTGVWLYSFGVGEMANNIKKQEMALRFSLLESYPAINEPLGRPNQTKED
jgi:hypothetical protein